MTPDNRTEHVIAHTRKMVEIALRGIAQLDGAEVQIRELEHFCDAIVAWSRGSVERATQTLRKTLATTLMAGRRN